MKHTIATILCVIALVVLGIVLRPWVRWWRRQLMGYHIGRVQYILGFGTSWLVWLLIAGLESRGKTSEALMMAKMIRLTSPVRDPVLLHREIMRGLREQAASMNVDPLSFDIFLVDVEQEVLRREMCRILFFHEPAVTVDFIDRLELVLKSR